MLEKRILGHAQEKRKVIPSLNVLYIKQALKIEYKRKLSREKGKAFAFPVLLPTDILII